jgi:hypothetical protein
MRLVGNAARMGEMRGSHRLFEGTPERKNYLEDLGVDGRGSPRSRMGKRTGLIWLRIQKGGGLLRMRRITLSSVGISS